MKRYIAAVVAAGVAALAGAGTASAHATCSTTLGIDVHGQHVVRDYVAGTTIAWPPAGGVGSIVGGSGAALPGGPGPAFHFEFGFAPGASFCNEQSKSPGIHLGP